MQAIMIILMFSPHSCELCMNESRSTIVSLLALKGIWISALFFLKSSPRMHSFSASRLLLISAPSSRLCLSLLWHSAARSLPAKSTNSSLPRGRPLCSQTWIWHMAWDRLEVSFEVVACVVRAWWAISIRLRVSFSLVTSQCSRPWTWTRYLPSSSSWSRARPPSLGKRSNTLPL